VEGTAVDILVVDDDPQVRRALTDALRGIGCRVAAVPSGRRALAVTAGSEPDAVVLDLRLPDLDGLEVIRRVRTYSDVPIVVFSGAGDPQARIEGLLAGADDFVDKPCSVAELSARLTAVGRRYGTPTVAGPRIVTAAGVVIDLVARRASVDGVDAGLTNTEWRIVAALAAYPGVAVSYGWIIRRVWSERHGDELRGSLRAHVRSLRRKLGDDARAPRLVRTEVGYGYRWIAEG
jgi:two-component system, OmpR family, KDP operon response regulator KdpE